MRALPAAWLSVLVAGPVTAQAPASLFDSHDPLELTLAADFSLLLKDRSQKSEYRDAVLSFRAGPESTVAIDVRCKTRGIFRLNPLNCQFPPLMLNLPRKRMAGTAFSGQNRCKLVTHCRNRDPEYEQYVHLEYLAYRLLNLLTERSFRVRPARVTYVDQSGKHDTLTKPAFLIEDDSVMAARYGAEVLEQKGVHQDDVEQEFMALVAVFQYMIGNTDWSVRALHNIVITRDTLGRVFAVPYDFDWSGIVNTRYAKPQPMLGIRTVRERLYRGFCRPRQEIEAVLPRFLESKDAIYALYRDHPGLEPKTVERTLKYLDEFYARITDPKAIEREFVGPCRRRA